MTTPMHRIGRRSNYDLLPSLPAGSGADLALGWDRIVRTLREAGGRVIVVEAYPGVHDKDLLALADALAPALVVDAAEALLPEAEIARRTAPDVTDDPVFGYMTRLGLDDLFDPGALRRLRATVDAADGPVLVHGVGASLVTTGDLLVYAGLPRWEIQRRQRAGETASIGMTDAGARPAELYKRGFFVDWRLADRRRKQLWDDIAFFLDTTGPVPKLARAEDVYRALAAATRRPFRVVPLFDPAPWGGEWIQTVCNTGHDEPNIGWCFDCVPEENTLLLAFGDERFAIPSLDLVFRHPRELLGEAVYGRFGDEFPIRFDFLDTMGGGNLSLQVHPLTEYIQRTFGMHYTQDESYYLLDADAGATVYLGVRNGIDPDAMLADLRRANDGAAFDAERYVNRFPASRHDHFLIPAGTVHCSGRDAMVLEISATPYIFTFKLWDWERPGLDGRPRPVHLVHGEASINWERDGTYARAHLVNRIETVAEGDGWIEERTGLHPAEFIETRRHWFEREVAHGGGGGVNVLNLVEGEDAVVSSPDGAFEPFEVHYAETFIVPAGAGPYVIAPGPRAGGGRCATIKAWVRTCP